MITERELFYTHLGQTSLAPMGLQITKAEGIYLTDVEGHNYIDLVSGFSVSNIGHRHPNVLEAIRHQLEHYLYINVYGEFIQSPQVQLAKRLIEFLPPKLNSVYFVNSGSEAIEGALKLAKRATGRTEIVGFTNAYHGSSQGALSILGNEILKNAFRPLLPDVRFLHFNSIQDLSCITERTACVVVETVQAEAGVILPETGFLESLVKRCREVGALVILDDVQMGFGRTGTLFSFQRFGMDPDILVLAKALGGGMPLGAFISSKEIMHTLAFNPELGHITTFGGHPVCCAAALASLDLLIASGWLEEVEEKGQTIEEHLKRFSIIKEIRRAGLMLGVELNRADLRGDLTQACLDEGLIIDWFLFHPTTFRIAPPLSVTKNEIEIICSKLEKVLSRYC